MISPNSVKDKVHTLHATAPLNLLVIYLCPGNLGG